MKRLLAVLATCASMNAAIITLADGENSESTKRDGSQTSRVWDIGGGITMTVTAFSLFSGVVNTNATTTQFGSNNSNETANVATIGLGVCSVGENCDFNAWQVDNNQGTAGQDFLRFEFSGLVNIVNVRIRQTTVVGDSDAVWATGAAATSISTLLSGLNASNDVNWTNPSLTFGSFNNRYVTINSNGVQQLILGTPSVDQDDLWKAYSIEVNSGVPEPGSLALLGSGLLGLGVVARRRRKQ